MKKINMNKKGEQDFMNYASAVIKSRAIPCAEDNLKPVQRRILYAMAKSKLWSTAKTTKCASVVGLVMSGYHPHGDASIYDALIRMSQWWKMRYPLIEIQGNNGSLNGDGPAAHRYTECRLTSAGEYLLKNVDPDVVHFVKNYDGTTEEPILLPSMFPNVLCNGSLGIAVGLSCSLLPHNLNEVSDLIIGIIKGEVDNVTDAMKILKGPDFPLGGVVVDGYRLASAYQTGQGAITLRAKYEIDAKENTITFYEFPYLVDVETRIIKSIKDMVGDGYEFIDNVENHIGKEACSIKVILTKKANAQKVLNDLFDKTPLQTTIKINNTVIVNGIPMTMNLIGLCKNYIKHQHDVITKMAIKEKAKQDHIIHINQGYVAAILKIDEVIKIIRNSDTKDKARVSLIELLGIDAEQADAVLALQLGRLTKMDANDINVKISNAQKESNVQANIIGNDTTRDNIIIGNLNEMKRLFGDERRTTILVGSAETEEDKKTIKVEENITTVVSDGSVVDIPKESFTDVFKKGGQLAKYKPLMWKYNNKKPVYVLHPDGTTSNMYDNNSKSLFLWDNTKNFIVTVSAKGIMKKSLMSDYKKVDKLCKVKAEDKIIYAFSCNDADNILVLLGGDKIQRVKVADIKTSSKLTIGSKGATGEVLQAACIADGGLFYTIDAENHCKKSRIDELTSTTVSVNAECAFIGAVEPNIFWYDGSKINPINWDEISIKSRTSIGSKLGTKSVVVCG